VAVTAFCQCGCMEVKSCLRHLSETTLFCFVPSLSVKLKWETERRDHSRCSNFGAVTAIEWRQMVQHRQSVEPENINEEKEEEILLWYAFSNGRAPRCPNAGIKERYPCVPTYRASALPRTAHRAICHQAPAKCCVLHWAWYRGSWKRSSHSV